MVAGAEKAKDDAAKSKVQTAEAARIMERFYRGARTTLRRRFQGEILGRHDGRARRALIVFFFGRGREWMSSSFGENGTRYDGAANSFAQVFQDVVAIATGIVTSEASESLGEYVMVMNLV